MHHASYAVFMPLLEPRVNKRCNSKPPTLWVEDKLRNFGFIWSQFGTEDRCEPGIPSLMNYVMERTNERESSQKQKF